MKNQNIFIREAKQSDYDDIMTVERLAFGSEEEAELTSNLINDSSAAPILSLLGYDGTKAVGHILFTRARIKSASNSPSIYILAPLAIIPEYQNMGIGKQLIVEGLRILTDMKVELVFVLGHIKYYPKAGFIVNATNLGYPAPYPIPEIVADAWMVQELVEGSINKYNGQIACCDAMDDEKYWRE